MLRRRPGPLGGPGAGRAVTMAPDPGALLALACAVAREAAGLLDAAHGRPAVVGTQTGPAAAVRWIVDPLDGTVNYLYGLPDWAVSIAAEVSGQVVAGVVCAPRRDAIYGAVRGGGAWRASLSAAAGADGLPAVRAPLACNRNVPLARALIATGFGYDPGRRRVQGQVVSAVLPR